LDDLEDRFKWLLSWRISFEITEASSEEKTAANNVRVRMEIILKR
jgi:hypothetical protein